MLRPLQAGLSMTAGLVVQAQWRRLFAPKVRASHRSQEAIQTDHVIAGV
ncbi:MAG: hypothetical protein HYW57_10270 [Ignavibacteriales bacterium]|nr:hypothetical protein [Ignavibacteriales bacterium]